VCSTERYALGQQALASRALLLKERCSAKADPL